MSHPLWYTIRITIKNDMKNEKLNYDTVLAIVSVTYTATLLAVAIIALALTS
jgi:hypothetical protein|tara:strand:- start:318 stop:473 length:156 start_codon:yes stop_codon:yes gene_type:complete